MLCLQRPYVTPGYSYTGWSPPAQSNEASNGYEDCVHYIILLCIHAFGDAPQLVHYSVAMSTYIVGIIWNDPTVPS